MKTKRNSLACWCYEKLFASSISERKLCIINIPIYYLRIAETINSSVIDVWDDREERRNFVIAKLLMNSMRHKREAGRDEKNYFFCERKQTHSLVISDKSHKCYLFSADSRSSSSCRNIFLSSLFLSLSFLIQHKNSNKK